MEKNMRTTLVGVALASMLVACAPPLNENTAPDENAPDTVATEALPADDSAADMEEPGEPLEVVGAWVRLPAMGEDEHEHEDMEDMGDHEEGDMTGDMDMMTGALYFLVRDLSGDGDRLLGVSGDIAESVELHQTEMGDDGVGRMRPVDGIDVPPGGEVALEPGGFHAMLIGLNQDLDPAGTFDFVLDFERAGDVPLEVSTIPEGAMIEIVEPADGSSVDAGPVTVAVEVQGMPEESIHWHLYVDGTLAGMVEGDQRESLVTLEPGEHELRATLNTTASHDYAPGHPEDTVTVTVE